MLRMLSRQALSLALLSGCLSVYATDASTTLSRGAYLARAADCAACHTASGGPAYAGGHPLESPLGTIYATNITPATSAGIGSWSEAQFARAVRNGIAADGHHLYPAMPYTEYAGINDDDMHALYNYFRHEVPAVDHPAANRTHLRFPFNIRAGIALWNAFYLHSPKPVPISDAKLARGRYLVDVLGHCGSCHTPRNALMATDPKQYLAGADIAGWHAPNLSSDPVAGIGGWTEQELATYLKTGHVNDKAQAAGPMAEAIEHSLRYLSDDDLQAIAHYLKSVPAQSQANLQRPAYAYGEVPTQAYDLNQPASETVLAAARTTTPIGQALLASRSYTATASITEGARLFVDACASCHQPSGAGTKDGYYPSLYHNTATGSARPNNLIMAILHGVDRHGADGPRFMPGFADDMNDTQIAAVANFVATTYGNPQLKIDASQVKRLRNQASNPPLPLWPLGLGLLGLLAVLGWFVSHRRRRN